MFSLEAKITLKHSLEKSDNYLPTYFENVLCKKI